MRIGAVQGNGPTGYFDKREPIWPCCTRRPPRRSRCTASGWICWSGPRAGWTAIRSSTTCSRTGSTRSRRGCTHPSSRTPPRRRASSSSTRRSCGRTGRTAPSARSDVQTHAKRHPVPFGEYVPDRAFFDALAPDLIGLIGRGVHPGHGRAGDPRRQDAGRARDLLRRDLRRADRRGHRRRRAGLGLPDQQRRFPRHRGEPAAARDRPDARGRDRARRRQHLHGRHQPGDPPGRIHPGRPCTRIAPVRCSRTSNCAPGRRRVWSWGRGSSRSCSGAGCSSLVAIRPDRPARDDADAGA